MKRLLGCCALVVMLACGDDDGGDASCSDVCAVADDCGLPIPDCLSNCASMTTPSQRSCVVTASDCTAATACFSAGPDAGGTDVGDDASSCGCIGAINGDGYDVACGETFCADGLERMCGESGAITETGETCGGSCIAPGDTGCSAGMNCCDVPGGTPVCMDDLCCQLNGPATSSSTCCFVFVEEGDEACCAATVDDTCS